MSRADHIEAEGTVVAQSGGGLCTVVLDDSGAEIQCTLAGKLRIHRIKVILEDRVRVAITPYQLDRGIITYRYRQVAYVLAQPMACATFR